MSELRLCCPVVWDYTRKPCEAWGAPSTHGCKKDPGHDDNIHVCPCGSRHQPNSRVFSPDPARAVTVRRTLTDRIPHFNTSSEDDET